MDALLGVWCGACWRHGFEVPYDGREMEEAAEGRSGWATGAQAGGEFGAELDSRGYHPVPPTGQPIGADGRWRESRLGRAKLRSAGACGRLSLPGAILSKLRHPHGLVDQFDENARIEGLA